MSRFLSKTIPFGSDILRPSPSPPTSILCFLQNPNVFQLRWLSTSSEQHSFTVSYLKNSLGFSPEAALSASRYVNFETPHKPDKVRHLFEKYGFNKIQVSSLVKKHPAVLVSDTEKTILPKLEFLKAKGMPGPDMAKMLSAFPYLLKSSLDKQIVPTYDFFRNLLRSDEKVIAAVKRCADILTHDVEKYIAPNIEILREHRVPDPNITKMVSSQPRLFMVNSDRFRKTVEEVEEMGFDASKLKFVVAVHALRSMSKPRWESKIDVYKKWGWSEEEVLKAFQSHPMCLTYSEDKIMASMDFFISQMGWRPCHMFKYPAILGMSLKKRVVPRCAVFQVLLSKGLVEEEVSIRQLLMASEAKFLKKFFIPYEKKAPELLKVYTEKLSLSGGLEGDDNI